MTDADGTGATGFRQEKPRQGGVRTHAPRADREASRGRQVAPWESPSQSTHVRGARVDVCDETLKGGLALKRTPKKSFGAGASPPVPVPHERSATGFPGARTVGGLRWGSVRPLDCQEAAPRPAGDGCADEPTPLGDPGSYPISNQATIPPSFLYCSISNFILQPA